jgi:hypothetical protein
MALWKIEPGKVDAVTLREAKRILGLEQRPELQHVVEMWLMLIIGSYPNRHRALSAGPVGTTRRKRIGKLIGALNKAADLVRDDHGLQTVLRESGIVPSTVVNAIEAVMNPIHAGTCTTIEWKQWIDAKRLSMKKARFPSEKIDRMIAHLEEQRKLATESRDGSALARTRNKSALARRRTVRDVGRLYDVAQQNPPGTNQAERREELCVLVKKAIGEGEATNLNLANTHGYSRRKTLDRIDFDFDGPDPVSAINEEISKAIGWNVRPGGMVEEDL